MTAPNEAVATDTGLENKPTDADNDGIVTDAEVDTKRRQVAALRDELARVQSERVEREHSLENANVARQLDAEADRLVQMIAAAKGTSPLEIGSVSTEEVIAGLDIPPAEEPPTAPAETTGAPVEAGAPTEATAPVETTSPTAAQGMVSPDSPAPTPTVPDGTGTQSADAGAGTTSAPLSEAATNHGEGA